MNSLFSSFDPSSWLGAPFNWISIILVGLLMPSKFWINPCPMLILIKNVYLTVHNDLKSSLAPLTQPGFLIISLPFFTMVILNNSTGLLPYTFTATSHFSVTLSLAMPLWIGHMLLSYTKTTNHNLAHLVPLGTPSFLIPFMVMVEIVSSIIRPVTLAVRLAANMIAGHILMTLLGSATAASVASLLFIPLTVMMLLLVLELAVSLIQAYVFSVLSTLYLNEVNTPHISF